MSTKRERNYGIDLLRIVSMLMVVVLHVLGQGGVLNSTEVLSAQYGVAWFLEIAAYCAVNCYALISGYVGLNSKFKYSNIVYMWLQVAFYSVLITVVFALILPEIGMGVIVRAFLPVVKNTYWYFTAYFAVFFFTPVMNKAIIALTKKQLIAIAVAIVILFSVVPTWRKIDLFYENSGYSALWLALLYFLGGIINKCEIVQKTKSVIAISLYFASIGITWMHHCFVESCNLLVADGIKLQSVLVSYISPTILFAGVFLFITCAKMKVGVIAKKLIKFFAPLSFSVYLIHVHGYVWQYIMLDRFTTYAEFGAVKLATMVLVTAVVIYLACSLIDFVRDRLFKILRVREILQKLEVKLVGDLWN